MSPRGLHAAAEKNGQKGLPFPQPSPLPPQATVPVAVEHLARMTPARHSVSNPNDSIVAFLSKLEGECCSALNTDHTKNRAWHEAQLRVIQNILRIDQTIDGENIRTVRLADTGLQICIDPIFPSATRYTKDLSDNSSDLPTAEEMNTLLAAMPGKTVQERTVNLWNILGCTHDQISYAHDPQRPEAIHGIHFWTQPQKTPGLVQLQHAVIEDPKSPDSKLRIDRADKDSEAYVLAMFRDSTSQA